MANLYKPFISIHFVAIYDMGMLRVWEFRILKKTYFILQFKRAVLKVVARAKQKRSVLSSCVYRQIVLYKIVLLMYKDCFERKTNVTNTNLLLLYYISLKKTLIFETESSLKIKKIHLKICYNAECLCSFISV